MVTQEEIHLYSTLIFTTDSTLYPFYSTLDVFKTTYLNSSARVTLVVAQHILNVLDLFMKGDNLQPIVP